MTNVKEFANIFVQSFITKIKEDKLDVKNITYWGFFGDPCLYKHKRIGVYGWIEFNNHPPIASSLDESLDNFDSSLKANDYLRYIEENIIVVANKMFVDFLQADA